jgi:hypothetical protein
MTTRQIVSTVVGGALAVGLAMPADAQVRRRIITTDGSVAVQSEPFVVKGDIRCPEGFVVQVQGRVYAFQDRQTPAQFGGVDEACWVNPPFDPVGTVHFLPIGDCVLCAPLPPGATTSGGGVSRSPGGNAGRGAVGGGGGNGGALPSGSGDVGD